MDFYEFLRKLEHSMNEVTEKSSNDKPKTPNTTIKTTHNHNNDNIINTARIMLEYHVPVELICQSLNISEEFLTANGLIKPKTRTFHFPVKVASITEHTEEIEASSIEEAKMLLLKKIDEYNETHDNQYMRPVTIFE